MFKSTYDCEKSIKFWAKTIMTIAKVFMWLCVVAAIIILAVDSEELWWIALIVLGDGFLTMLGAAFITPMIWGFGDIVGNARRMIDQAAGTPSAEIATGVTEEEELPEL